MPKDFDGIVYDIGRGKFDHHQDDKEYRENGCPYAAFGLLWREFGAQCIGEEEALRFDEKFIQPLDESDNTGCDNDIAKIILNLTRAGIRSRIITVALKKPLNLQKLFL